MCLLTFFPPGVLPNADHLRNGAETNDDGHGWALVTNGQLIVNRGLKSADVIDAFVTTRKLFPEGPALFHSRWSTGGLVDVGNCHPFYVGRDHRTVLAHNGVLFSPPKGDQRSDTRIFAETVLPHRPFGSIDSKRGRKRLEKHLGAGNKIVILTTNPAYRESFYLVNGDAGRWCDGVWYSNDGYLPSVPSRYWWDYADWKSRSLNWKIDHTGDDESRCVTCDNLEVNLVTGYCAWCGTCQECLEPGEFCLCYTPASLDRTRR